MRRLRRRHRDPGPPPSPPPSGYPRFPGEARNRCARAGVAAAMARRGEASRTRGTAHGVPQPSPSGRQWETKGTASRSGSPQIFPHRPATDGRASSRPCQPTERISLRTPCRTGTCRVPAGRAALGGSRSFPTPMREQSGYKTRGSRPSARRTPPTSPMPPNGAAVTRGGRLRLSHVRTWGTRAGALAWLQELGPGEVGDLGDRSKPPIVCMVEVGVSRDRAAAPRLRAITLWRHHRPPRLIRADAAALAHLGPSTPSRHRPGLRGRPAVEVGMMRAPWIRPLVTRPRG